VTSEPPREIGVAIILDQGEVLVTRRPAGTPLGGWDEFPGGGREPGESLEECVVRETLEETTLQVRPVRLIEEVLQSAGEHPVHLHFFECELLQERPPLTALPAWRDPRWIRCQELPQLRFPAANASVVRKLST
jgi:mutator protein MutT